MYIPSRVPGAPICSGSNSTALGNMNCAEESCTSHLVHSTPSLLLRHALTQQHVMTDRLYAAGATCAHCLTMFWLRHGQSAAWAGGWGPRGAKAECKGGQAEPGGLGWQRTSPHYRSHRSALLHCMFALPHLGNPAQMMV